MNQTRPLSPPTPVCYIINVTFSRKLSIKPVFLFPCAVYHNPSKLKNKMFEFGLKLLPCLGVFTVIFTLSDIFSDYFKTKMFFSAINLFKAKNDQKKVKYFMFIYAYSDKRYTRGQLLITFFHVKYRDINNHLWFGPKKKLSNVKLKNSRESTFSKLIYKSDFLLTYTKRLYKWLVWI